MVGKQMFLDAISPGTSTRMVWRGEMVKGIDRCLVYSDTILRGVRTVPGDLGALR